MFGEAFFVDVLLIDRAVQLLGKCMTFGDPY